MVKCMYITERECPVFAEPQPIHDVTAICRNCIEWRFLILHEAEYNKRARKETAEVEKQVERDKRR